MQYVVTYDIADERRRARLAKALLDFGKRIEESVFLFDLDDPELVARMRARVEAAVEPLEDCVHIFPLCGACSAKIVTVGLARLPQDQEFYVV